ncbi:hypothetical protein RA989_14895, partial [Mycobacteroides abscessus subsp. massiliense]
NDMYGNRTICGIGRAEQYCIESPLLLAGQQLNSNTATRVAGGQVPLGHTTEASEMNARVHFRVDGVC